MTRTLGTLARVTQSKMDDLCRKVADLEEKSAQLHKKIAELDACREREHLFSQSAPEYGFALEHYLQTTQKRKKETAETLQSLQKNVLLLRENLHTLFGEQKRYELLKERKLSEAQALREQQERSALDEISLVHWHRRASTPPPSNQNPASSRP
ncbi:MAG: flagellar FliJ family protein [Holosporales bacterium]|jgi:flagellar export protein FliJ|nr:flagellar FliJ family protein [Holosporales bacterium]